MLAACDSHKWNGCVQWCHLLHLNRRSSCHRSPQAHYSPISSSINCAIFSSHPSNWACNFLVLYHCANRCHRFHFQPQPARRNASKYCWTARNSSGAALPQDNTQKQIARFTVHCPSSILRVGYSTAIPFRFARVSILSDASATFGYKGCPFCISSYRRDPNFVDSSSERLIPLR